MHLGMVVDELRWLRYAVYHAQGGKPKKPHQYPRPGVAPTTKRRLTAAGREYLSAMRAQRQAGRPAAPAAYVPPHIANARAKQLGPAERDWLRRQLRRKPNPPPEQDP